MFYFILAAIIIWIIFRIDCSWSLAVYELFYPNYDKLKGKVVWLIGGSTGIGECLAYRLAECGCKLIISSRTESELQRVKSICLKRARNVCKDEDVMILPMDVTKTSEQKEGLKKILERYPQVDMVINNAGRIMISRFVDDDVSYERQLWETNYFANVSVSRMMIQHWLKTKFKGQLVITSSIAAYSSIPYWHAYNASKAALNGFYDTIRFEYAPEGIIVTVICPGPAYSSLYKNSLVHPDKLRYDQINSKHPFFMETQRCADLMTVAIANKFREVFICNQPFLYLIGCVSTFRGTINRIFEMMCCRLFLDKLRLKMLKP